MTEDERFMQRAIRLAMNGRGRVEPNPMVGCVIVKNGQIIGEGYHEQFGGPHAEPNALANCSESPEGATAYVTLEPCCHTEKKTPPCVPRLIEAKVGRVVVGATDPNPQVNGQGIAQLRATGVLVDTDVLANECRQLLAPFIAQNQIRRPYVTLKWAQTADDKIAGHGGARLRISNERSTKLVHQLRGRSDGILVGINTALVDDPILTPRHVDANRRPVRIVVDSTLLLRADSKLVQSAMGDVVAICTGQTSRQFSDRVTRLRDAGVQVMTASTEDRDNRVSLLFAVGVWDFANLLVEPGPTLARSFFQENLVDRLWVFRSPKAINDPTAPAAAPIPDHFIPTGTLDLDGDTLTEYLNPKSPVFFSPVPSADFILARDSA